jgi:tRNA threonylcarbamoyladenosine biosynthesis protein TsaB
MKILAFETSAKAASVALLTDGQLTGEYFQNSGQTHSRTVMKLAKDLLSNCDLSPADLDLIAWANGPGSFTGVRIGVAAAKGLCWGLELPCVPVSTLEAMAWSAAVQDGVLCCCMDARRSQVYNAVFEVRDGRPVRLREDRAISIEELAEDLKQFEETIRLTGDGALLVWNTLHEQLPFLRLGSEHIRQQRASGVALAAWEAVQAGRTEDPALVLPNYLRLSQAERERLEKDKQ